MEERAILSERLEDQLTEQKRILKEKGERLSKELTEKMTTFILKQKENSALGKDNFKSSCQFVEICYNKDVGIFDGTGEKDWLFPK